jgi:rhodanese-related sulfurtransferase
MDHSPGFLTVVNEQRPYVNEVSIAQAAQLLSEDCEAVLVDVREDHEWQQGHAVQAVHLGKGILERDLEHTFPDPGKPIIMYCGGGYRSVLAAAVAQKLGYRKVYSLMGGYKGMVAARWPIQGEA